MTPLLEQQRQHWDDVADGWSSWMAWTRTNFRPITDWLRQAVPWRPGASALDAACGAGYPLVDAGVWVHPGGRVVAADLSPRMLLAAAEQARMAGLEGVEFVSADAEHVPSPDQSFDIVTNAYGLMFCEDPARAVAEAYRVLRPDGGMAVVTWDEISKNPFFSVIYGVAAPALSLTPPLPGTPGPFRLDSPEMLQSLLQSAGFESVDVESRPATFVLSSAVEYLRLFADVAWRRRMAALPRDAADALERDLRVAAAPYVVDGALRLRTSSLCASGRKRR